MSARHLAVLDGTLCATVARATTTQATSRLSDATCTRCAKELAAWDAHMSAAIVDRRMTARMEADCRAVGVGHLWDALEQDQDTAYGRMVRGLLASLASYFVESGADAPPLTEAQIEGAARILASVGVEDVAA